MGVWSNVLMMLTVLGLQGGSAGLALGPPSQTVAPWYERMQTKSEGTSAPPQGEFLFAITVYMLVCVYSRWCEVGGLVLS